MSQATITHIKAQEILDSRGDPTVEATVILSDGTEAVEMVPSGASTGVHEAHELRDGDKSRYEGKGVLKAIANIEKEILPSVKGMEVTDQAGIDAAMRELDGTKNKSRLGANAILGVSLACARAAAQANKLPLYVYLQEKFEFNQPSALPIPLMNVLNGGRHANTNVNVQESMLVPKILSNGKPVAAECVRVGSEVFHILGEILKKNNLDTGVGNEGGYAPSLESNERALALLTEAIKNAGYTPGQEVSLALDVAASEFFRQGKYNFEGKKLSAADMINIYKTWSEKYSIISIEDGLAQDDWQGWHQFTEVLGGKLIIIGDDVFVTNEERIKLGFEFKAANAVLIKPNQIGTLSETIAAIKLAKEHGYSYIVSHRSGETIDTFIVDLAVATSAPYLKAGAPSRGERVAKYNRLIEIEAELNAKQ